MLSYYFTLLGNIINNKKNNILPEYFILFDTKYNNHINNEKKYEIINLHALKINFKNNKLHIIDKFDYYIKPVINPELSIYTINSTNITQDIITNHGCSFNKFIEDFYIYSNNINKEFYKLPLYSYNNDYLYIKNNLILNNIDKSSKYYKWKNMFLDIKFILKKYNIDTNKYTLSTLYQHFSNKNTLFNKYIQVNIPNFDTYSLYITLQYLLSN